MSLVLTAAAATAIAVRWAGLMARGVWLIVLTDVLDRINNATVVEGDSSRARDGSDDRSTLRDRSVGASGVADVFSMLRRKTRRRVQLGDDTGMAVAAREGLGDLLGTRGYVVLDMAGGGAAMETLVEKEHRIINPLAKAATRALLRDTGGDWEKWTLSPFMLPAGIATSRADSPMSSLCREAELLAAVEARVRANDLKAAADRMALSSVAQQIGIGRGDWVTFLGTDGSCAHTPATTSDQWWSGCQGCEKGLEAAVRRLSSVRRAVERASGLPQDSTCGEIQLARYPGRGTAYSPHLDAPLGGQKGRLFTIIAYLNAAWVPGVDGGALRLHIETKEGSGVEHVDVEPACSNVVVFQSPLVEHQVMPAWRDRYALTMWVSRGA